MSHAGETRNGNAHTSSHAANGSAVGSPAGSPPSSPRRVRIEEPDEPTLPNDRFSRATRSLSNTTITDDNRTTDFSKVKNCDDANCAFGWETYVVNYVVNYESDAPKRSWKKIPIHRLLHDEKNNPLLDDFKAGQIRHVHLPANNMKWVEDLIRIYYHDEKLHKQQRLLRREFWHGQIHGRRGPIHARFMRPHCNVFPDAVGHNHSPDNVHRDFVISMPYLHWETDKARRQMYEIVEDIERLGSRTLSGVAVSDLRLSKLGKKVIPKLIIVAKKKLLEKADAEEMLLRTHLKGERPVHIRRTLDQSYYWTLKDTSERDQDQVVYRATKTLNPDTLERHAKIIMVDQLWLWILDGQLVITSFPRRWGRKKSDPSGVYRTIRERLDDSPGLENVYDMAIMMIDQCSRVFFDRTVPRDSRPEMIDSFSAAIGDVTDKSIKAYKEFWEIIRPNSVRYQILKDVQGRNIWDFTHSEVLKKIRAKWNDEEFLLAKLLDINPEGDLLKEIKDILDELHMITKIYSEQEAVVETFYTHIQKLGGNEVMKGIGQGTMEKAAHLVKAIQRRKEDIKELTKAAKRTADGLKELLDLKQKHANIAEARAGVSRAEEANKILTESQQQTIQGSKQSRSLMIFTIVTIVFLPLGFFSSVFGMNAPEFGQGNFHIWKQFLIMFPVSIGIIIFSLALALSEDFLSICGVTLQLWWVKILQKLHLFDRWKKGDSLKTAIEKRNERLKGLYKEDKKEGTPGSEIV